MKKFNKRLGRSRSGVSDIIGNLLILAITVTLFSSIMFYVANMPEPAEATFTDLEPSLSNTLDDDSIWVNVTHKGGQTLKNWTTGIYLFVNGTFDHELHVNDGGLTNNWKTGDVWRYNLQLTGDLTSLSIMIVDKDTNSIVWQADLLGGVSGIELAPIIGMRYTSPSPGMANETLTVFVRVMDPNDDNITDVHLDLSVLGLTDNLTMDEESNGLWSVDMPIKALFNWDNRRITIFATDETGRTSSAIMALDVLPEYGGGGGGGGSGWPPGNLDYSGLQGFAIFEWQDWEDNRFDAIPQYSFDWGVEDAVIVVASKYVVNADADNIVRVLNQTTKVVQSAVSNPNNEFQEYDYITGYYVYNCTIDTSKLPMKSDYYLLEAALRDTWVPSNQFTMNSRIFVSYPTGTVAGYPKFLTFKDSGFTTPSIDFTTYDSSSNKIYVEIQNIYGIAWVPNSGDVEIRDFFWNPQIKGSPSFVSGATSAVSWTGSISNLWQVTTSPAPPGVYRFVINLGNATSGWPWIGGDNAYILRFDMFKAGPETYLLNKLVNIDAPMNKLDIVAGGPPAGSARFQEQASLYYYANDNSWEAEQLEVSSDKHSYSPTVYLVKAGDINGDSKSDFVAVMYDNSIGRNVLMAYIRSPTGDGWLKSIVNGNLGTVPKAIELGNLDLDNDLDVVTISSDGKTVHMYRNDGLWTRTTVYTTTGVMTTLLVGDMDPPGTAGNDPERSQDIVVGFSNGQINVIRNKFGDATAWNTDSLTGTGFADIDTNADWEMSVYGTTTNTYLQTQNPFQDPGVYEQITEEITRRYTDSYPSSLGENNTATDELSELIANDSIPYTVLYDQMAHVDLWDSTGLLDDLPMEKVTLKVRYMTTNYQGGSDYIIWHDGAINVTTIQIAGTNGVYKEAEFDLTPYFTYASGLSDLSLSFNNTFITGASVDFDYWLLNVTWKTGDLASHVYHFTLPTGTTNSFNVHAAKNDSSDVDTFRFYYSTNNLTWTAMAMSPTATINSIWPTFTQYTFSLPNAISEVWVKVEDTDRVTTSDPVPTWVRIGLMYVRTYATTTPIGNIVTAMELADMDQNGANDILVSTQAGNYGKVFVLYNRVNGIFNPANIAQVAMDTASKGPIYNTKWITAGAFFNPYQKGYLDIVFATSTQVYNINQTALGSWSTFSSMFSTLGGSTFTLKKVWAGDVDGNQRTDLLLATAAGGVWYYSNYEGKRTMSGWQLYMIDQLESASGPGVYLNDMDACLVRA